MPRPVDFNVEAIEPVKLLGGAPFAKSDLMSPFVWKEKDGLAILVRVVRHTRDGKGNTGSIYYGTGTDGLTFRMHRKPVIAPGPGPDDIGGCEDPTVMKWQGKYVVYYTGVDETRASGQLLYASGDTITELRKSGVAHRSSKSEGNTKEATIGRTGDHRWRLFYEYARNNASLIGLALGKSIAGPWRERTPPFRPRKTGWDNWHLSTGPLLTSDRSQPVMFYNGATEDARWRIGWIAFNHDCTKVVARCLEPLIVPPPPLKRSDVDIAFAASVVAHGNTAHLYYSLADRAVFRAVIRRS